MPPDLIGLAAFALVSSITPGPNNLMLMASGANFGLARTVPHMLGISGGFAFMIFALGAGLMRVFDAAPETYTVLKVVSIVYMLWLAWRIASAAAPGDAKLETADNRTRPLNAFEAALFQWVNPKGWAMALTALTMYTPGRSLVDVAWVSGVFLILNVPSVAVWAVLGVEVKRWLTNPLRRRGFNLVMAALLIASMIPVLWI